MSDHAVELIVQADTLQTFVDQLAALVDECVIEASPDGLAAATIDPANVAQVDVELDPEATESFDVDETTEIGVNVTRLDEALDFADSDQLVHLALDTETQHLIVSVGDFKAEIAVIDPKSIRDQPDIPDLDLPTTALLDADALGQAVDAADWVGDYIGVRTSNDKSELVFEGEGDTNAAEVRLEAGDLEDAQLADADSLFSIDYWSDLQSPIPSDVAVTLQVGEECPVRRRFSFAEGRGRVVQLIAPRMRS